MTALLEYPDPLYGLYQPVTVCTVYHSKYTYYEIDIEVKSKCNNKITEHVVLNNMVLDYMYRVYNTIQYVYSF